jgi:hypothetical protein
MHAALLAQLSKQQNDPENHPEQKANKVRRGKDKTGPGIGRDGTGHTTEQYKDRTRRTEENGKEGALERNRTEWNGTEQSITELNRTEEPTAQITAEAASEYTRAEQSSLKAAPHQKRTERNRTEQYRGRASTACTTEYKKQSR